VRHPATTAAVIAAAVLALACNVEVKSNKADIKGVKFVSRDSTRHLGPGDVRIASEDSALELAIVGDSIVAGFGAKVRDKIARETDTTKVSGDGMGASIEKFVKGTVATALNHDMMFPVSEISDVRYEDGFIRFYDRNGKQMNMFQQSRRDRDDEKTRFSERDADAFISAFRAKKTKV
jgi:hypothetical protein